MIYKYTKKQIITMALLAAASMLLATGTAAEKGYAEKDYDRVAVYQTIEWRMPSGERVASGLQLLDSNREVQASRLLVEAWDGHRAVLTSTIVAPRGTTTLEFRGDRGGGWLRLEIDHGIKGETMGAYYAASDEVYTDPEVGTPVTWTLATSDGFELRRELRQRGALAQEVADQLAAELLGSAQAERVLRSVPRDVAGVLPYFDLWADAEEPYDQNKVAVAGFYPLMRLILKLRAGADAAPRVASSWRMVVGQMVRGASLVEPELLEFTSRFRSVDNSDPFFGYRADQVRWKEVGQVGHLGESPPAADPVP